MLATLTCAPSLILKHFCEIVNKLKQIDCLRSVPRICAVLHFANMNRRKCLTDKEKADIVSKLFNGENASKIADLLACVVRTVRKYVSNSLAKAVKKDKGKSKVLTRRDLSRVKRQLCKNHKSTTSNIILRL